jgi:hypothetical protein
MQLTNGPTGEQTSRFPGWGRIPTISIMSTPEHEPTADAAVVPGDPPPTNGNGLMKPVRQLVVFVLGMSVLVVGIAMIVLPGPAMVVIPAGLAILATEFVWAQRWLKYLKNRARDVANWTSGSKSAGQTPVGKPENDG